MELQEFITETLTQIVNGVVEAQKKLADTGCLIVPYTGDMGHNIVSTQTHKARAVQKVKMNIVLNVTEGEGKSSKIGVFKILQAGISSEKNMENTQMTSIEFEVPLALPVMNGNE